MDDTDSCAVLYSATLVSRDNVFALRDVDGDLMTSVIGFQHDFDVDDSI